jgi:hypothetical protein
MLSCQHALLLDIDLSLPTKEGQTWKISNHFDNVVPSFSFDPWYFLFTIPLESTVELDKESLSPSWLNVVPFAT